MKILHLNTSDSNSGAARGTYWTHQALKRIGVDSHMLVAEKLTNDSTVIGPKAITGKQKIINGIRQTIEYWPLKRYPNKSPSLFSPAIYSVKIGEKIHKINPDIVNIHWTNLGFLRPEDLRKIKQPIVWTLRDMWSFTGGCHYTSGCAQYKQECGRCPALGSNQLNDLSHQVWKRKYKAWKNLNLTLVPTSQWLADCIQESPLLMRYPYQVIPNAVDTEIFRPIDKNFARYVLGIPSGERIIIFGAINPNSDKRKGFSYLLEALKIFQVNHNKFSSRAVIFGSDHLTISHDISIPYTSLGYLHDDVTLAIAYSAADVMVVPSTQEAFGKTAIEAMACGTPVVSFDTGGLRDIVSHQENGYRAECFNSEDLANGIAWILENSERWIHLSCEARATVKGKFSFGAQANIYKKLYETLLES